MNSNALRVEVERALSSRIPSALTMRNKVERPRLGCGIQEMDALLHGGFPAGAISEIVGPQCSGRSTAAAALIAELTSAGMICAWVDATDTFDPESGAANGVDLERLLWVRCRDAEPPSTSDRVGQEVEKGVLAESVAATRARHCGGGGSPHPRAEGRGMPEAIQQLLQVQPRSAALKPKRRDKGIGTPGAVNRPLTERVEQVATDRLPPRRGKNLQPFAMRGATTMWHEAAHGGRSRLAMPSADERQHSLAVEHALRATDLLLQGGGFAAIVLDMGSTPARIAWRVPLSSWFRFRTACDRSRTCLVVLTQHPCARSSAEVVVHMAQPEMQSTAGVMDGVRFRADVERQRFVQQQSNLIPMRKPPVSEKGTRWMGKAAWAIRT